MVRYTTAIVLFLQTFTSSHNLSVHVLCVFFLRVIVIVLALAGRSGKALVFFRSGSDESTDAVRRNKIKTINAVEPRQLICLAKLTRNNNNNNNITRTGDMVQRGRR